METKKKKLNIFSICPAAHIVALISTILIAVHLITRHDQPLMNRISGSVIRPIHRFLSVLCSRFSFSAAEILITLFALTVLIYIVVKLLRIVFRGNKLREAYSAIVTLAAVGLTVYALYCMLWGVYYYGDDFVTISGLEKSEISVEQLETVTAYFADGLNRYGRGVLRDERGFYIVDRAAVLARSDEVFKNTEKEFPSLAGENIRAKGMFFSRIMSYLDFTGFFFPFTAEANVNTDFPPSQFAATVAHELSHQRGVAKEQEANFTAVLACLDYGDADYCYSACMLAYVHLGNALYDADHEAWMKIYESIDDNVKLDMALDNYYWEQFETPVQTVSNTVYEGFLQSYDQKLGMKSYGACVDLLVNYYYDAACQLTEEKS